jgi:hypothetical protein
MGYALDEMSYCVHIEREGQRPIVEEEWLAIVGRDPELRLKQRFEATNPRTGEVITVRSTALAGWLSHPAGAPVLFDFVCGRIAVANPDEHTLAKMREIANHLDAVLRDDEGNSL